MWRHYTFVALREFHLMIQIIESEGGAPLQPLSFFQIPHKEAEEGRERKVFASRISSPFQRAFFAALNEFRLSGKGAKVVRVTITAPHPLMKRKEFPLSKRRIFPFSAACQMQNHAARYTNINI
jgi:hypothetical protein